MLVVNWVAESYEFARSHFIKCKFCSDSSRHAVEPQKKAGENFFSRATRLPFAFVFLLFSWRNFSCSGGAKLWKTKRRGRNGKKGALSPYANCNSWIRGTFCFDLSYQSRTEGKKAKLRWQHALCRKRFRYQVQGRQHHPSWHHWRCWVSLREATAMLKSINENLRLALSPCGGEWKIQIQLVSLTMEKKALRVPWSQLMREVN